MAKLQLRIQLTKDPAITYDLDYKNIAYTSKSQSNDPNPHITIGMMPMGDNGIGRTFDCPISADQDIDEVLAEIQLAIKNGNQDKAFVFPYDPRA